MKGGTMKRKVLLISVEIVVLSILTLFLAVVALWFLI